MVFNLIAVADSVYVEARRCVCNEFAGKFPFLRVVHEYFEPFNTMLQYHTIFQIVSNQDKLMNSRSNST